MGKNPDAYATNRNVIVAGHRTSIRLPPDMWSAVNEICLREGISVNELCTGLAERDPLASLTASLRLFALSYYRRAATEEGHESAGHGTSLGAMTPARACDLIALTFAASALSGGVAWPDPPGQARKRA